MTERLEITNRMLLEQLAECYVNLYRLCAKQNEQLDRMIKIQQALLERVKDLEVRSRLQKTMLGRAQVYPVWRDRSTDRGS